MNQDSRQKVLITEKDGIYNNNDEYYDRKDNNDDYDQTNNEFSYKIIENSFFTNFISKR